MLFIEIDDKSTIAYYYEAVALSDYIFWKRAKHRKLQQESSTAVHKIQDINEGISKQSFLKETDNSSNSNKNNTNVSPYTFFKNTRTNMIRAHYNRIAEPAIFGAAKHKMRLLTPTMRKTMNWTYAQYFFCINSEY